MSSTSRILTACVIAGAALAVWLIVRDDGDDAPATPNAGWPNFTRSVPVTSTNAEPAVSGEPAAEAPESPNADQLRRPYFTFAPSPSIAEHCRRWRGSFECKGLADFMASFSAEPRSPVWATDMETRIARDIIEADRHAYTIRSLECRTTRCAVEVESSIGWYIRSFDDAALEDELFPVAPAAADEDNPATGERVIVSVQTWIRADAMDSALEDPAPAVAEN